MSLDPTTPPPIEPDSKDWTWVLERPCPDCGFDAATVDLASAGDEVRRIGARFAELLADPLASVRPDEEHWSATEYACHVRDVFRLFDTRLGLMLDQDDPLFANWDQDVTAVEDGYATQDPATVAAELLAAGDVIAASFDGVTDEQRSRVGRRSDGAVFTVDSFARYFLHDPVHHVWDVEQGYARLA
ncbi:MAG: DinB family protein [Microthrixaceae bacterium]